QDRVDRVPAWMEPQRLADLEPIGFARQHQVYGFVRRGHHVLVEVHRDDVARAVTVRGKKYPLWSEVADDDHRFLAAIPEHQLLELSSFATDDVAIEGRLHRRKPLRRLGRLRRACAGHGGSRRWG